MHAFSPLQLVTKADAAAIFGVCVKTIDNFIKEGRLPQPVQFSTKEYWHYDDFRAFLDLTFRRMTLPHDVVAAPTAVVAELAVEAVRGQGGRGTNAPRAKKDSNPVVQQRSRQSELLKRLNAAV